MRDDKFLTRISGLLRQAEGTDNEHEAQAFMQAAQRLATASSIDLAVARAHDPAARKRSAPLSRRIAVGEKGKRGLRTFVELFLAIARANDVQVDIAHDSTYVIAFGFEADIDAVEALYSSLVVQMVAASSAYLRSGEYKSETVQRLVTKRNDWGRPYRVVEDKPVAASTARINFQSAFAERIGARLTDARNEAREEAVARERADAAPASTAIALRNKEIEVANFHKQTSDARGSWRGSRASAGYSDGARRAGDSAGRSARISGQGSFGGARGAIGS
ncbi:DUF2786 domain-containing protein [Gordonia otitidis]|uniref:DUF2786 domain-containing protein n=1 Tax=Gordonia otitidis TaxID=249058 RepID=UPI001D14456F|nr:DUF2786 domain-containing protein [Gordonia otitidis]UEA61499.1 DUF2786 domain-containing protein [Gordonia otitidis]